MARSRPRSGRALRIAVEARARSRCEYCHAPQSACGYRFHVEHIVPVSQRGSDDDANRALACATCNLSKSDRSEAVDPLTGQVEALFNPRSQDWGEHFQWSDDATTIEGKTPTGRTTVAALGMNGDLPKQARPFWFRAGLLH